MISLIFKSLSIMFGVVSDTEKSSGVRLKKNFLSNHQVANLVFAIVGRSRGGLSRLERCAPGELLSSIRVQTHKQDSHSA